MTIPESSLPPAQGGKPEVPLPRGPRPQPKPQDAGLSVGRAEAAGGSEGGAQAESESIGSGSATGFVSMLARRQFDADQLSATPADAAARRDRLQMAHEVERGIPVAQVPTGTGDAGAPRWHRVMFPISLMMAAVLLAIGGWAIGALIYMHRVSPMRPQDVHYPLISWRLDVGNMGGYTPASQFMAEAMVLCIPVAALLVLMAWLLRGQARER